MSDNPLIIIGCGDIGRRVAARYLAAGRQVVGVVRSEGSAALLDAAGIEPRIADLANPPLPALPLAGADLFYFAPPPPKGEQDPLVANLIRHFDHCGRPRRVVYISTTGVYGDCGGAWVDEMRPVNPVAPRAKRRWDAECAWQAWREASDGEIVILRVPGIYGPDRLPLERLRAGLPLVCEAEAPYTNRIHAEDLADVCVAAMRRGRSGEVYNAGDGHPGTMTDYFNRIADRAGLPRPPQIPLVAAAERLSEGMLSYMRESRRLDNRKLREDLGVVLRYPSLEEGLPSCFPAADSVAVAGR